MTLPTQQQVIDYFIYDPETGIFTLRERPVGSFSNKAIHARHLNRLGKPLGCANFDGYIKIYLKSKYYSAHSLAWLITYGYWVKYPDFEIDHINGIRSDNRIENLRIVTKSQNQRNSGKRITNTSGVHGVNWKPKYNKIPGDGRWVARIWNGPKHVYLGSFKTLHEASIARKAAERALGYTGTERDPAETKNKLRRLERKPCA